MKHNIVLTGRVIMLWLTTIHQSGSERLVRGVSMGLAVNLVVSLEKS